MSAFEDIATLAFTTTGVNQVIKSYQDIANADERLRRLQEKAYYTVDPSKRAVAQVVVNDFIEQRQQASVLNASSAALAAIGFIKEEVAAVREAIEVYGEYGKQIRTIQGITGATARQAEQFENVAKIGGISDIASVLEVVRLNNDFKTPRGKGALSKLGINPSADLSSLDTFNKVISKLQSMRDGVEKTGLEIDLFGMRGVRALQPFLNVFPDIADRARSLDANLGNGGLQSINHLQQNTALLGQTFLVDFIIPIAQHMIPAVDFLTTSIENLIAGYHRLDELFGGAFSWIIVIGGVAAAFVAMSVAVTKGIEVLKALQVVERTQIVIQAIIDALSGPGGWIALGVATAVGGAAYFGAQQLGGNDMNTSNTDSSNTMNDAANTFHDSVTEFSQAVRSWASAGGNQITSGISEADFAFIMEQRAQGAVG